MDYKIKFKSRHKNKYAHGNYSNHNNHNDTKIYKEKENDTDNDNFNDNFDNDIGRKIYKHIQCSNCGKFGHEYRFCYEPVTSIGIILLKFDYNNIMKIFADLETKKNPSGITTKIDVVNDGIKIDTTDDILLFSKLRENISFLMVQRKHTVGYVEFVRGRYKTDNIDGIVFLFQQMTKTEIERIGRSSISELWDDFWVDPEYKFKYDKEFEKTKRNFEKIKHGNTRDINLEHYVNFVKPTWDQPEWGFPKGRRNKMETDMECAIREFEEETGFNKNDYTILEGIKPFIEEVTGTNGIRYNHTYYVAYSKSDKIPDIDQNNIHQVKEIGDIGYYTYNDVMKLIRPYHIERKKIVNKLYMYFIEKIIKEIKTDALSVQNNTEIKQTNIQNNSNNSK